MRRLIVSLLLNLSLSLGLTFGLAAPAQADHTTQHIICDQVNQVDNNCGQAAGGTGEGSTLASILRRVIRPLLLITGILSVVMIIVGGLRLVISAGSQEAVQAAKRTISYALIGLIITILAYAIVSFTLNRLLR